MRKLLVLCLSILFSLNIFANCDDAYENAALRRDARDLVIATGVFTSAGILSGGLYYVVAVGGFYGVAYTVNKWDANSEDWFDNQFEKISKIESLSDEKIPSNFYYKIISRSLKKAGRELNDKNIALSKKVLRSAYDESHFCPLVKIKKNGKVKRAVFNKKAIVSYLSEKLMRKPISEPRHVFTDN